VTRSPRWLAEVSSGAATTFRIGTDGDQYVAEWTGVARLVAGRAGEGACFTFEAGTSEAMQDKIRGGAGSLLLRHLRGQMGLHGAAVQRGGRALVLLGPSSAGKSTLVEALVNDHEFELLADDAVAVDGEAPSYVVAPTERRVWLARPGDHSARKVPRDASRVAKGPATLAAFVALSFSGDRVALTPRAHMARARDLVAAFVRFALDDHALLRLEAQRITELSMSVPFLSLARPRAVEHIGTSARLLSEWASL
jgi:hypothetical protein